MFEKTKINGKEAMDGPLKKEIITIFYQTTCIVKTRQTASLFWGNFAAKTTESITPPSWSTLVVDEGPSGKLLYL